MFIELIHFKELIYQVYNKITKFMNSHPEKFVSLLDSEDLKKIFPETYYNKYALHLVN